MRSNGALKLSSHYLRFQAFVRLSYGASGSFELRDGVGFAYWKCIEAYLMKKLRFDGGFDGF
jgi:hypothetical protein